jgi:hypothetical protein
MTAISKPVRLSKFMFLAAVLELILCLHFLYPI